MQHEKRARLRRIRHRLCGPATSLDRVAGWLDIDQRQPASVVDFERRNRIVAAISRKQETPVRRDEDARRAFERVRRAVLSADGLELAGASTARAHAFRLRQRAVSAGLIVDDRIFPLVGLSVEMPGPSVRPCPPWVSLSSWSILWPLRHSFG